MPAAVGGQPIKELFRGGHLSLVIGTALADQRRVVVKARPAAARMAGCVAVQQALALAGFPAHARWQDRSGLDGSSRPPSQPA